MHWDEICETLVSVKLIFKKCVYNIQYVYQTILSCSLIYLAQKLISSYLSWYSWTIIYLDLHTLSITDEEEQREYESFKRFIKQQKDRQKQKYDASQGITEATQGDKT